MSANLVSITDSSSVDLLQSSQQGPQRIEETGNWEQHNTMNAVNSTSARSAFPGEHPLLVPNIGGSSHLPTPLSPGNIGSYTASAVYASDSPSHQGWRHDVAPTQDLNLLETAASPTMTPNASPVRTRRSTRQQNGAISQPGPSVPQLTSRGSIPPDTSTRLQFRSNQFMASGYEALGNEPSSLLSSEARPSMSGKFAADAQSTRTQAATSHDRGSSAQIMPMDVVLPETSVVAPLPPISAPVPQLPINGEAQRIRLQIAADQAARIPEIEARRPDYLVREKRPHSPPNLAAAGSSVDGDVAPSLGITVTSSPLKGRRLQLFQETSDESFEQSLLAGGYPGYGSTPAPEPQVPTNNSKTGLSQRALQWLQQATPGVQTTPPAAEVDMEAASAPSEKDIRKRRRLAAFEWKPPRLESPKLHAVELEGKGRVLMDVPSDEVPAHFDTPESPSKRRFHRRKRRGAPSYHAKKALAEAQAQDDESKKPLWLDTVFPWSVRSQERAETERVLQEERLKWIERYLDRESDSSDENENPADSQALQPVIRFQEDEPEAPRPGRGKMVPLRTFPDAQSQDAEKRDSLLVPIDPADARAALLSKRSVRMLALRRRREMEGGLDEEDLDGEVDCMCGLGDDGRPLVQCDDCRTWYHLVCVGVKHPSELGDEDDPWYCPDCLGIIGTSEPPSEPTFVPTDDKPLPNRRNDPLFYQGSLQSPSTPWREPKTPVRGRDSSRTVSTRSTWLESSGAGPSTPVTTARDVRVYTSPLASVAQFDSPAFDPTNTPTQNRKSVQMSSGMKWTSHGLNYKTPLLPSEAWKQSAGHLNFSSGPESILTGSPRRHRDIYSWQLDDTPVNRAGPQEHSRSMTGERLWDSPISKRLSSRHDSSHDEQAVAS
ncbi:hypothetical protein WOLCODRAFT_134935 [Wolfiporia cocos MD-104 SS10]|uniref:PHD-type domain-containing protein n=1 Tax=Wolfiporia cocos (strain MD-104) TaxID=742152 RepID=A0A2H3J640_WOLCO|nr:hypothetical protein WOLCODRAFT_134935 [Wolfiporia cocos MD-104 SS10]